MVDVFDRHGVRFDPRLAGCSRFVRHSDYAELAAENERLKEKEAHRIKIIRENENLLYSNIELRRKIEALANTGAVKVKALDEDDYEEIINAAGIALRNASHGIRGQVITVYDSLDWWVMKETERRILSALEPAAPEGQQEPVAVIVGHHADHGYRIEWLDDSTPVGTKLYTRPSEQAVTEAMVEAAWNDWQTGKQEYGPEAIRAALKAAMEAGG